MHSSWVNFEFIYKIRSRKKRALQTRRLPHRCAVKIKTWKYIYQLIIYIWQGSLTNCLVDELAMSPRCEFMCFQHDEGDKKCWKRLVDTHFSENCANSKKSSSLFRVYGDNWRKDWRRYTQTIFNCGHSASTMYEIDFCLINTYDGASGSALQVLIWELNKIKSFKKWQIENWVILSRLQVALISFDTSLRQFTIRHNAFE